MRHPRANVLYVQNNDSFLSAPVPCPKPFRNKHLGVIVDKALTQGNAWRRGLRCPLCRIFTVGRKRVDSQRGRLTPYLSLARPNAALVFLRVRFARRSLPVRPFQARRPKPTRPGTPARSSKLRPQAPRGQQMAILIAAANKCPRRNIGSPRAAARASEPRHKRWSSLLKTSQISCLRFNLDSRDRGYLFGKWSALSSKLSCRTPAIVKPNRISDAQAIQHTPKCLKNGGNKLYSRPAA